MRTVFFTLILFLTTDSEGQAVLEKFEYGSAAKNLGVKRWRPDHGIASDRYEKDLESGKSS